MKKSLLILAMMLLMVVSISAQPQARYMTSLQIYPDNVTMEAGDILRFTAVSRSHSGMMHTPPTLVWSATGGRIDPRTGEYVAGQVAGTYSVMADFGGHRSTARVEIRSLTPAYGQIVRVDVSPDRVQLRHGEARQFTAIAYDNFNRVVPFQPRWQVTGGGNINSTGYFQARQQGTFTVTATDPNSNSFGSAIVTVGQQGGGSVARIDIFPQGGQVTTGQTCKFTATAYDSYGQIVSCPFQWRATGGQISQSGDYTAGYQNGTFSVWARDHRSGIEASTTIRVIGGGYNPDPNPGHGEGRLVITHWDVGGGNWLRPKAQINLTVHGRGAQTVKLFAVTHDGYMNELQARSCSDGSEIRFDTKYDRLTTASLEIRLYNNRNQVIAQDRRNAD